MKNYRLTIEYDGSRYDGWQRLGKGESANTISNKISDVLEKMCGQKIDVVCGCRTETGVHAYAQTINFKIPDTKKAYEVQNYLNRYLPRDIAVIKSEEADERFDSKLNAKAKTYVYQLDTNNIANVFERKYRYHMFEQPDWEKIKKGAQYFLGTHDFKNFSTAKKSKTTVKSIKKIEIVEDGAQAQIRITANDFLHNMARLMIGLLLDIGNKKREPEDVLDVFAGKPDVLLSPPAESYALFLENIEY